MSMNDYVPTIVQDISLGLSAPKWFDKEASPEDRWRSFDALTTYGVKLWQPEMREWCEISVQGNVFRPRVVFDEVGERMDPRYTNELTDGSIIDICGAVFLFQNPVSMAELIRKHVSHVLCGHKVISVHSLTPSVPSSLPLSHYLSVACTHTYIGQPSGCHFQSELSSSTVSCALQLHNLLLH